MKTAILAAIAILISTIGHAEWTIYTYRDGRSIANLAAADALIASTSPIASGSFAVGDFVGFNSGEGTGHFTINYAVPGIPQSHSTDNYAIKAVGHLQVPSTGNYTFGLNTDDGARLRIDGSNVIVDDVRAPPHDSAFVALNLAAGTHVIEWTWYNTAGGSNGGGAEAEIFAAAGAYSSFNSAFKLIGDAAGLAVQPAGATFQPLANYQHNPADGRQTVRSLQLVSGGRCSFVFSTSDPGSICLISWSANLSQWSPLVQFAPTTAGTEVVDTPLEPAKFYRATYLPAGASVATNFDYPIGSGAVLEQVTPERNNIFPASPIANPDRGASAPGAGWYNAQDVGNYYAPLGGIHPGEDWNNGSGSADIGQSVRAVANGQIVGIKPVSASGAASLGYVILVRHWLQNGSSVDSLYVHVAPDKIGGTTNSSGTIGSDTDFTFQPGTAVTKGSVIGVIGAITDVNTPPHLHFEMRDMVTNPNQLWPSDTGNGYYGAAVGSAGRRNPNITAAEVQAAFNLMRKNGIIDPSDFIDDHR